MNALWSYSGSRPTVGFQEMKEQIVWLSLGANNCNHVHLHLPGSQNPAPKQTKTSMEKSHWRLQPLNWPNQPNEPSGKTWANHYIQVANRTLWPASAPEAKWRHGLCTLRLQISRTDGPPHPPGLSHLAETETPVMAAGWVNHQQAVGNGGRPAPHHQIPGNMWTEGLSTADRPQKKKKKKMPVNLLVNIMRKLGPAFPLDFVVVSWLLN